MSTKTFVVSGDMEDIEVMEQERDMGTAASR